MTAQALSLLSDSSIGSCLGLNAHDLGVKFPSSLGLCHIASGTHR
jgi:hypothetical protein